MFLQVEFGFEKDFERNKNLNQTLIKCQFIQIVKRKQFYKFWIYFAKKSKNLRNIFLISRLSFDKALGTH